MMKKTKWAGLALSLVLLTGCGTEQASEHTYVNEVAAEEVKPMDASEQMYIQEAIAMYAAVHNELIQVQPYHETFMEHPSALADRSLDRTGLVYAYSRMEDSLLAWETQAAPTERLAPLDAKIDEVVMHLLAYTDTMYGVLSFAPETMPDANAQMADATIAIEEMIEEMDQLGVVE